MRIIKASIVVALTMLSTSLLAQSSPNLSYGAIPTPGQWNSYFAAKQDVLGYAPVNKAGDTLVGKLNAMPPNSTNAGLNIGQGQTPTSLVNGDIWITASGLFIYVNNQILGPYVSSLPNISGLGGTLSCSQMPSLIGDVFSTSGLCSTNLATVNTNVGSFGDSGHAVTLTVDGKGRITAISSSAISISYTQVSGLGTAATTNVGTSGANVGLLNGNNTYSGSNSHTGSENFTNTTTVPNTAVNDNSSKALNTGSLMAQLATIPAVTVLPWYIAGNVPSAITCSSSTSCTATITAGLAAAQGSSPTNYITGAGYSWSIANGNTINGYQGGTTLPTASTVYFYLCQGTSGVGSFASASTTPTCPSGYTTSYRHIFSLTTISGVFVATHGDETVGGGVIIYTNSSSDDVSNGAPSATACTQYVLPSVPAGEIDQVFYRSNANGGSTAVAINFYSGNESCPALPQGGNAPWTAGPGLDIDSTTSQLNVGGSTAINLLFTNMTAQIQARSYSGQNGPFQLFVRGYISARRS